MSNFKTLAQTLQGKAGSASVRFSASTEDNLATITATGYMNDKANNGVVKVNDIVEVNYGDTSEQPDQPNGTYGVFIVDQVSSDFNLVAYPSAAMDAVIVKDVTVTAAALSSGGLVQLIDASTGQQFQITDIFLNGGGTNFSGGGGDRLLSVGDGTTVYTIVPAATLQSLANDRWGTTAVPYPVGNPVSKLTAAGQDLNAFYSGGTADYAAGSLVLTIVYARKV